MMTTLAHAHALLPGSVLVGDGNLPFGRVHSDTRTLRGGDLFVALRGERFDGHAYLAQARRTGAVAALAERGLGDAMPGLLVPDTLVALQQLAAAWRAQFTLPLIAVTGSNGKTTVTQMVAAILQAWLGADALATAGNLNNHIGVPLTLLRLRQHHRAAVLELGMNHAGEIALLAGLVRPTVALVNNAQREHQEFMANVEAVARENGAVIESLAETGTVVIPADDEHTPLWRMLAGVRHVLSFSPDGLAHVTAAAEWQGQHWALKVLTPAGQAVTVLRVAGRHNLRNALAAAACALAGGAPLQAIADGLAAFKAVAGRSDLLTLNLAGREVRLVDDSYNANPDSVLAAIDVLAGLAGPRWLVLGDMGEVGAEGRRFHVEVGAAARSAGIDHFWAAGPLCAHAGAERHFDTVAELLGAIAGQRPQAASILVKGSRFMKMEQVVQALKQLATLPAAPGSGAAHAA
jgi:UDP-N-acetylmuramoyl-tripeptide--D-alanyl-D-alanine ligase